MRVVDQLVYTVIFPINLDSCDVAILTKRRRGNFTVDIHHPPEARHLGFHSRFPAFLLPHFLCFNFKLSMILVGKKKRAVFDYSKVHIFVHPTTPGETLRAIRPLWMRPP